MKEYRYVLNSCFVDVIHWQGPGWYAAVQEGRDVDGRNEVHSYYIPGFGRDGMSEDGLHRIGDGPECHGLGTPGWNDIPGGDGSRW